jgi:hypothetical protein
MVYHTVVTTVFVDFGSVPPLPLFFRLSSTLKCGTMNLDTPISQELPTDLVHRVSCSKHYLKAWFARYIHVYVPETHAFVRTQTGWHPHLRTHDLVQDAYFLVCQHNIGTEATRPQDIDTADSLADEFSFMPTNFDFFFPSWHSPSLTFFAATLGFPASTRRH